MTGIDDDKDKSCQDTIKNEHLNLNQSEQNVENTNDSKPELSKRARKRLLKHEKWLEYRPIKRAKEKERLKKKKEEAKLNNIKLGPSRKQLKNIKMSNSDCKLRTVLDFSFDNLMTDKDLNKCVNQLNRCYSINRRSERPLQLYVTSFCGKSRDIIKKHVGFLNWDVNFCTQSYEEIFKKEELIYLTSDSENIIETLDESNVYIIGALVDHNSHKGLCFKKAIDQGIRHGKLPIREYLDMKTRQVLTIDHVFAILVNVASHKMSWKEAFLKVIPQRKGATVKEM